MATRKQLSGDYVVTGTLEVLNGITVPGLARTVTALERAKAELKRFGDDLGDLTETVTVDIPQQLEAIRNGDILDGAISRTKLDSGFIADIDSLIQQVFPNGKQSPSLPSILSDEVFPYGLNAGSRIYEIEQRTYAIEALGRFLDQIFQDQDEQFILTDNRLYLLQKSVDDQGAKITQLEVVPGQISALTAEIDSHGTRLSSVEQSVSSIQSVLAELEVGGEIIDLSIVTQTASRLESVVANGGYYDGETFVPTKDHTDIAQLADRVTLLVQGRGDDWASFSQLVATKSELSLVVQNQNTLHDTIWASINSQAGSISLLASQVSENSANISGLQTSVGQISSQVASLSSGLTNALTSITQTKDRINSLAAGSGYVDENNVFHPNAPYTVAIQTKDRFEKVIAGDPSSQDRNNLAAWVATKSEIAQFVTSSAFNEQLNALSSTLTMLTQRADNIELAVYGYLGGEDSRNYATREDWLAAIESLETQSITGLVVADGRINLLAKRVDGTEAAIQVMPDQILSAVSATYATQASLNSQVSQLANQILSAVSATYATQASLNSQVSQLANSINQRVQAKVWDGNQWVATTEAFLSLRIDLPVLIDYARWVPIWNALTADERVLAQAVYEAGTYHGETAYTIKSTATSQDIAALKTVFRNKGFLAAQYLVNADEILLDGTVRANHIDVDSVSTTIFNAIKADIQDLTAKKLKVDTDPQSNSDFEVTIDDVSGVVVRKNNTPLFSINKDSGAAYFKGNAEIENGIFRGSIEAGPLLLNKNPPANASFTISGSVLQFVANLANETGLTGGTFNCTGSYNGQPIGSIQFNISYTQKIYEDSEYIYITTISPPWTTFYKYHVYTWRRTLTRTDVEIKLFRANDGAILCSYSDYYEPSAYWVRDNNYLQALSLDPINDPAPSPNPAPATGGTVNFGSAGNLSFTSSAFTYRLVNLPAGYSSSYPAGTVYYDQDGFLKIKI